MKLSGFFISSSNCIPVQNSVCHVHQLIQFSHIRRHIASGTNNYTSNYVYSKQFRYKLKASRINVLKVMIKYTTCQSSLSDVNILRGSRNFTPVQPDMDGSLLT